MFNLDVQLQMNGQVFGDFSQIQNTVAILVSCSHDRFTGPGNLDFGVDIDIEIDIGLGIEFGLDIGVTTLATGSVDGAADAGLDRDCGTGSSTCNGCYRCCRTANAR
jgi:hypothetical protein